MSVPHKLSNRDCLIVPALSLLAIVGGAWIVETGSEERDQWIGLIAAVHVGLALVKVQGRTSAASHMLGAALGPILLMTGRAAWIWIVGIPEQYDDGSDLKWGGSVAAALFGWVGISAYCGFFAAAYGLVWWLFSERSRVPPSTQGGDTTG
jgi:hypothetical protein